MSEIIDLLKLLSDQVHRKCEQLSQRHTDDESLRDPVLKLCDTIVNNCEDFKKRMNNGNINSDHLIITLNISEIIGHDNCERFNKEEIDELKKKLEEFSKGYLTNSKDEVFQNLYRLYCQDSPSKNIEPCLDFRNNINGKSVVTEIFGSDIEAASSQNTQSSLSSPKKLRIISDLTVLPEKEVIPNSTVQNDRAPGESDDSNFDSGANNVEKISENHEENREDIVVDKVSEEKNVESESAKENSLNVPAVQENTENKEENTNVDQNKLEEIGEQKEDETECIDSNNVEEGKDLENLPEEKDKNEEKIIAQKGDETECINSNNLEGGEDLQNLPKEKDENEEKIGAQKGDETECVDSNNAEEGKDNNEEKSSSNESPNRNETVTSHTAQNNTADATPNHPILEDEESNATTDLKKKEDTDTPKPQIEEKSVEECADKSTQQEQTVSPNYADHSTDQPELDDTDSLCPRKSPVSEEDKASGASSSESEVFSVLDKLITHILQKNTETNKVGNGVNGDDCPTLNNKKAGVDSATDEDNYTQGDQLESAIEISEHCKDLAEDNSVNCSGTNTISSPINEILPECTTNEDINNSDKCTFMLEMGLKERQPEEVITALRDELYDLWFEDSCTDQADTRESASCTQNSASSSEDDEEKYTERAAQAALRELDEESSSFMDSLSEYDINLSDDTDLSEVEVSREPSDTDRPKQQHDDFIPKKCRVLIERANLEELSREWRNPNGGSSKWELRECSVVLKPLRISQGDTDSEGDEIGGKTHDEDAEIDRLCELSTLDRRKRKSSENEPKKRKIKRRRRVVSLTGSETSDLTDYSSVSDDQIDEKKELKEEDDDDMTPTDPNTLLMEIVCHTIHDSDSDTSSYTSSYEDKEDKREKLEKKRKEDDKKKSEKGNKDSESWRNDPLLKGSLSVPSDVVKKGEASKKRERTLGSSSENEKVVARRKKCKFLDFDYSDSSSNNSSDDFEDVKMVSKDSNGDSDIEYISSTTGGQELDANKDGDKKSMRRKILPVLSNKELRETTQKAAEEEKERVMKLEEQRFMRSSQETSSSEQDGGYVLDVSKSGFKVLIDHNISMMLRPHQIDGIKFMWEACYLSVDSLDTFQGTGCILAHNMGLGKTLQVVTLVHTLFNYPITKTKHVAVVCPLSTVPGWKKEFVDALKRVENMANINLITIESKHHSMQKQELVKRWKRVGGVIILGYEAFCKLTNQAQEMREALMDPGPDLIVCDEGHILKNGKSLRTRSLMKIRTRRRIVLTGTPLQNNLDEYYFMVQFVKPNLLGTKHEFVRQFSNPIKNGQYEDSSQHDIKLMKYRTHVLHRLLKNTVQRYEATELHRYLDKMEDYALFIKLHPVQVKLYKRYIQMVRPVSVNEKNTMRWFFNDYQILKFICSHPQLLQTMETQYEFERKIPEDHELYICFNTFQNVGHIKEKEVISEEPENVEVDGVPKGWWKSECPKEILTNIEFGSKLQVMMGIIEEAEKMREKVLIFTSSLVELSSVEYFLNLKGTPNCRSWKSKRDYFRMDGTVPPAIRTTMCDMFNDTTNHTMRVFLMSHKVGGLGLNLVAANRVILLGANFNPSIDAQSIYRAYRFGQEKKVYIYRLLSMQTMEEKIYHRCVTKLAIASRVVDKHQIARHYKNLDLEDLYKVDISLDKQRPALAKPDDDVLSSILLKFDCIHKYHHHQKLLENRPDEELNEDEQKKAWEEFEEMSKRERNLVVSKPAAISSLLQQEYVKIMTPEELKVLRRGGVLQTRTNGNAQNTQNGPDGSTVPPADIATPGPSGISTQATSSGPITVPESSTQQTARPVLPKLTRIGNVNFAKVPVAIARGSQQSQTSNRVFVPLTTARGGQQSQAGNTVVTRPVGARGSQQSQAGNTVVTRPVGARGSQQSQIGKKAIVPPALVNARGPVVLPSAVARGSQLPQTKKMGVMVNKSRVGNGNKHKSSAIGPNPLYKASLDQRAGLPWRTSSSDDFQIVSPSKAPRKKVGPGDRAISVDQEIIEVPEDSNQWNSTPRKKAPPGENALHFQWDATGLG